MTRSEEYFKDWFDDHHSGLLEDFAEEYPDEFMKFARMKCEEDD